MKFNEKIALLRKQKGMTQEALAFKLGISRQSVSKWETGECEPDLSKLKEIASMFEVSIDYLLNDNYEDEVDKGDKIDGYNVYNNYHIEKNSWLLITIVSLIVLLVTFIMSFFVKVDTGTDHSGFLGFLETWTVESSIVKVFMVTSIIFGVIGIVKIINSKRKKHK